MRLLPNATFSISYLNTTNTTYLNTSNTRTKQHRIVTHEKLDGKGQLSQFNFSLIIAFNEVVEDGSFKVKLKVASIIT